MENTQESIKDAKTLKFIKDAIAARGDLYDYSESVYITNKKPVKIYCKKHESYFFQAPYEHITRKCDCPKCAREKRMCTRENWIERARKKWGDKFNYDKVVYTGATDKVIIICPRHQEFLQIASQHLISDCPKCEPRGTQMSQEDYLKLAQDKWGDKWHKFDYSKVVYTRMRDKITLICRKHGEYEQLASDHVRMHDCVKCANEAHRIKLNDFIDRANKIHDFYYDYSKVVYVNSDTKVIVICRRHGEFYTAPAPHIDPIRKTGCPKCAPNCKPSTEEWISDAQLVYGDEFDYSMSKYISYSNKITIICKKHNAFHQYPNYHLRGYGCPKCQYCPSCGLFKTSGKLCVICKPRNENKNFLKTKEMKIVNYLRKNLPDEYFDHNKSVGTECTGGHYFPDIHYYCGFFDLIVEVDEFMHKGTGYECDKKRMYDITNKIGRPCVFIRFNPDSVKKNIVYSKEYLDEFNRKILLDRIKYYLDFRKMIDIIDIKIIFKLMGIDEVSALKTEYLLYN